MGKIHRAAQRGEYAAVLKLLDKDTDPNERDERGLPPLQHAAFRGHVNVVQLLIDRGAEVDAANHLDYNPLMVASHEGRYVTAETLLSAGANVMARSKRGWTPLHYAAGSAPDARIIDILVSHGADVNALDNDGTSPLILASYRGASELVEKLLYYGADVTIRNVRSHTALSSALEKEHAAVAQKLEDAGAKE